MHILKFGGTSLGNAKRILNLSEIITDRIKQAHLGVVLSAVSGVTNILVASTQLAVKGENFDSCIENFTNIHQNIIEELGMHKEALPRQELHNFIIELSKQYSSLLQGIELIKECPEKTYCKIVSMGERASARIVVELLRCYDIEPMFLDAMDFIKTKGSLIEGTPIMDELEKRFRAVKDKNCLVMSGFIASDMEGNLSLLGRNGSDYSASLMAVGVGADCCEIWTDVDGIYTADPSQVQGTKPIEQMSYGEAMELAFYGAKVLHPKTTAILVEPQIPLYIKNSFNPSHEGTKISTHIAADDEMLIRAVSHMKDIALFNIYGAGMKGTAGIAARILEGVAKAGVSVILISQSSSEYSFCFCVAEKDANLVLKTLHDELSLELRAKIIENIEVLHNQAVICIVGDNMCSRYGIAGKFFSSLAHYGINIVAIAQGSSERCISAVIDGKNVKKAVQAVHQTFFHSLQSIQLYIIGAGSIGSELIEQIRLQYDELLKNGVEIKVCAISNSTKLLCHEDGIDLNNWRSSLKEASEYSDVSQILEKVMLDKPLNGIFVDCTSSEKIANCYSSAFKAGLNVVTANKKANSSNYAYYKEIRSEADKYKRVFLYETNVGAGLPVIDTFKGLMKSGDELLDFSGILSGSLSFIFGALEEGATFSEAVMLAYEKKFTEPDPRDDLSGMDVARKLLILAREAGLECELEDINIEPIFPSDFNSLGKIDEFLANLGKVDNYFAEKMSSLKQQRQVLRYVGEIKDNKCNVGIRVVSPDHPLYSIKNGENAFAFLTKRYSPIPFVVRGYGAGVGVTASGLFGDILKNVKIN